MSGKQTMDAHNIRHLCTSEDKHPNAPCHMRNCTISKQIVWVPKQQKQQPKNSSLKYKFTLTHFKLTEASPALLMTTVRRWQQVNYR